MKRVIICTFVFICILCLANNTHAMLNYQVIGTSTGLVTASRLNIRCGPDTNFSIIGSVNKNEYIRLFAKIGDWYVIQTNDNYIGAVSSKYVRLIYPNASANTDNTQNSIITTELTQDEKEVFNLINQKRIENGLPVLKIDDEVQNVARIKAKDMVDNNYFSHTSPIYGSPFEMLNKYKIPYKAAGENIAGNSSNSDAVEAWMNSSRHKANILNSEYNYTGIGIVKSSKYGKIYVQMFIKK